MEPKRSPWETPAELADLLEQHRFKLTASLREWTRQQDEIMDQVLGQFQERSDRVSLWPRTTARPISPSPVSSESLEDKLKPSTLSGLLETEAIFPSQISGRLANGAPTREPKKLGLLVSLSNSLRLGSSSSVFEEPEQSPREEELAQELPRPSTPAAASRDGKTMELLLESIPEKSSFMAQSQKCGSGDFLPVPEHTSTETAQGRPEVKLKSAKSWMIEGGVGGEEIRKQAALLGASTGSKLVTMRTGLKNEGRPSWIKTRPRVSFDVATNVASLTSMAGKLLYSRVFEGLCAAVILANTVTLGFAADAAFEHNSLSGPAAVISYLELFFCCFYALEIGLRMFVQRFSFFTGSDYGWNSFDLLLVVSSVVDQVETLLTMQENTAMLNFSFLRSVRLMKMLKLLRVIRMLRIFRELRFALNSILGSMKCMSWAVLLITATTYMFGIAILMLCTDYLEANDASEETRVSIEETWGTVGRAMLSLFMASTSGDSWKYLAMPLSDVGILCYGVFLVYLSFFTFVITNTLTSLFLENAIAFAERDDHQVVQAELEKKDLYVKRLQQFFRIIDDSGDGQITYDKFCRHLDSPELLAFAASLGIEALDAKELFMMLSVSGTQPVDLDRFVVGCIKLKGDAKSMDLLGLTCAWTSWSNAADNTLADLSRGLGSVESLVLAMYRGLRESRVTIKQQEASEPTKQDDIGLFGGDAEDDVDF